MPRPDQRTRSLKRVHKASPGGSKQTHYKRKSSSLPHCHLCNRILAGISHSTISKIRKLNRSKRRIMRPYGGHLCPSCLKNALKQAVKTFQH